MEEKRLDAAESLELIGRMIRNTRQRLESHSGRPYLVWGYTTVGISLLNYALNRAGADPLWSLSWFLIPILGYALMRLFPERRPTDPRTEIDRIVNAPIFFERTISPVAAAPIDIVRVMSAKRLGR